MQKTKIQIKQLMKIFERTRFVELFVSSLEKLRSSEHDLWPIRRQYYQLLYRNTSSSAQVTRYVRRLIASSLQTSNLSLTEKIAPG